MDAPMREFHFIKPNHNKEKPHHIIVVDTETRINQNGEIQLQTFRLGFAIYLRWDAKSKTWIEKEYELRTINDFYILLDKIAFKKRKLYVFAHNASFDYTILKMDTYFSTHNYEIIMRAIDSVFLIKAFKKGTCGSQSIVFSDTMNYYRMSLQKLGEIFGERKMKTPDFDNVTDNQLMQYCKQDVKVLRTVIKQHILFLQEHDLGNFKLTIASQSFNAFCHRFMNQKILIHCYPEVINMEMDSYRGGRCEAFKLGKYKNIYKLDVNSMYPYVMSKYKYPTICNSKVPLVLTNKDIDEAFDSGLFLLADCDIKLKLPAIAVKKEKLLFPIGNIRQMLTHAEIEYIMNNPEVGEIIRFQNIVTYQQSYLFKDYVSFFYNLRKSTINPAYQQMSKLFLNSLYGKFGQKSVSTQSLLEDKDEIEMLKVMMAEANTFVIDSIDNDDLVRYIKLGEDIYRIIRSNDLLANESFPIIASNVTAHSRLYLFSLMLKASLDNVLYCDTDSLFVTEDGFNNLKNDISQDELGKLKLEDTGEVEIFGVKNYVFNGEVKLKGIKKDAEIIGENMYKQNQFMTKSLKYRKAIPDGIIVVRPIIKNVSLIYDKGIVDYDTGIIKPFIMDDFE